MEPTTYEINSGSQNIGENKGLPIQREGCCPTCGQQTNFTFLGEQRWPEKVAAKLGLPAVMVQWSCESCHTTLSEPDSNA